jgi:hypothetical protein
MEMARSTLAGAPRARSLRARLLRLAGALALTGAVAGTGTLSTALAESLKKEFSVFNACPVNNPQTVGCIYSSTSAGEFKLGSKSVPINRTIILQGGNQNESNVLIPAEGGETLSAVPLKVPGGLVGIEFLGNFTEVNAVAEPAGTIEVDANALGKERGTAVLLPLKVRLTNPILGNSCYIGSNSAPMTAHLTTGTTSPPGGVTPLTGSKGTINLYRGAGKIVEISGTRLVDNTFPAPGVQGCGGLLSFLLDPAVDLEAGLPASAGGNAAILESKLETASVGNVRAERTLPELGRCVPAPSHKEGHTNIYEGSYENAGCTDEIPFKDAKYEWHPGPGANRTFTTSGKSITLETVAGAKLKCAASSGSGEYTGTKSATLAVTLSGCKNELSKQACQSSGAGAGEIRLGSLNATLGFIQDEVLELDNLSYSIGWALSGGSTLVQGQCGANAEALVLSGAVIGKMGSIDKMTPAYNLQFEGKGGVQKPESFEEEPKQTLTATVGGQGAQPADLSGITRFTSGETVEFKAVDE